MADPLQALRGAQSIRPVAPNPYDDENQQVTLSEMPLSPGGVQGALGALRRWGAPLAQSIGEMLPQSIRGGGAAIGRTLGEMLPEFTAQGGETAYNAGRSMPGRLLPFRGGEAAGELADDAFKRGVVKAAPVPRPDSGMSSWYQNNPMTEGRNTFSSGPSRLDDFYGPPREAMEALMRR